MLLGVFERRVRIGNQFFVRKDGRKDHCLDIMLPRGSNPPVSANQILHRLLKQASEAESLR